MPSEDDEAVHNDTRPWKWKSTCPICRQSSTLQVHMHVCLYVRMHICMAALPAARHKSLCIHSHLMPRLVADTHTSLTSAPRQPPLRGERVIGRCWGNRQHTPSVSPFFFFFFFPHTLFSFSFGSVVPTRPDTRQLRGKRTSEERLVDHPSVSTGSSMPTLLTRYHDDDWEGSMRTG